MDSESKGEKKILSTLPWLSNLEISDLFKPSKLNQS